MNGLFFLVMNNFFSLLNSFTLAIICSSLVAFLTILCAIISLAKRDYSVLKRLWVVFDFVAICIFELWLEMQIDKQSSYLFLTVGVCFFGLSICLFLPVKKFKITKKTRSLAQFLDRCAHSETLKPSAADEKTYLDESEKEVKPSKILSSSIIKANQRDMNNKFNQKNDEIDFSHVKSILARLEYYPLKEQDKKSAKLLEKAILEAEENGLDKALKQTINEGLGALLKIMAKYAV